LDVHFFFLGGIPTYVKLLTQCWAQQPEDRPLFGTVVSDLEKIEASVVHWKVSGEGKKAWQAVGGMGNEKWWRRKKRALGEGEGGSGRREMRGG
jgi:hypothetical protein